MANQSKLTPQRHVAIVGQFSSGQRQAVVAGLTGVGERSLERWLARGQKADEQARERLTELPGWTRARVSAMADEPEPPPAELSDADLDLVTIDNDGRRAWTALAVAEGRADGQFTRTLLAQLDERERPYWRLWRAVTRAKAAGEGILIQRWRQAATGVDVVEETVVEHLDADGNVTERVVTTKTRRNDFDWRAAERLLAAREPEHYAPRRALTAPAPNEGAEGEPASLEDEQARALAGLDELDDLRQRKAAGQ